MTTRRKFLALALAGSACAMPLAAFAQTAPLPIGAIRIDASPAVVEGWGANVALVKAELQRALAETLGPVYRPGSGTTLVVSLNSIWLASYAGGGGGGKPSDGGSSNDYLESVATIVDRKGGVLASYPIRSTESSGGAGAWYRPDIDQRRLKALARNNALWIARYIKGGGSLF